MPHNAVHACHDLAALHPVVCKQPSRRHCTLPTSRCSLPSLPTPDAVAITHKTSPKVYALNWERCHAAAGLQAGACTAVAAAAGARHSMGLRAAGFRAGKGSSRESASSGHTQDGEEAAVAVTNTAVASTYQQVQQPQQQLCQQSTSSTTHVSYCKRCCGRATGCVAVAAASGVRTLHVCPGHSAPWIRSAAV